MGAYPVSVLVDAIIEQLEGTAYEEVNLLASDFATATPGTVGTLSLLYSTDGAVPGIHITIDDEDMLVLNANSGAKTIDVLRGMNDSGAPLHSAGAMVHIDPPWPRARVMTTLRDELRSWGPQVYQVKEISPDIVITSGIMGYDLGDIEPFFGLLSVRMKGPAYVGDSVAGWGQETPVAPNQLWPTIAFEVMHDAPTTDFPSGNALFIRAGQIVPGNPLHILYSAPFDVDTSWTDETDLVTDVGLDTTDLDIPVLGVAWRLMMYRQTRRLFTQSQGQGRDATEVPALALMQAAEEFKKNRDSRLMDAQRRLMSRFPFEMDVS